MDTAGASYSSFGCRDEGKTRLPGLCLLFLVQLWFAAGVYLLGACYFGYRIAVSHFSVIIVFLMVTLVAGGGLCLWAAIGIVGRSENAPARCQVVLSVNLVGGFLIVGAAVWRACMRWYRSEDIPFIIQVLCVLIVCEAWRRYFGTSLRVKAAFVSKREEVSREAAAGSGPEEPAATGEMGLICVLCWLGLAWQGVECALYLLYFFVNGENVAADVIVRLGISCLAGVAAPLFILHAISIRKGARSLVFWGLGIWLAAGAVNYLIYVVAVLSRNGYASSVLLNGDFSLLNASDAFALAVWWYMAVSEKAKAWFS